MSNLFRKAERRGVHIKLAITGPSGSGKTTAAILMARGLVGPGGKIALIDTENRSASLYADLDDFDVLDVEAPYEQGKFVEAIEAAIAAGYDCLVIDSFSHVWEAILAYKDQLDRRGGNSFTNWNAAGEKFKDVLGSLLSAKLHVIACMRAKMEFVIEENAGKKTVRKVGLAPIMRDGIEFEFTTVFDLDMSHNAATSKDRTRLFDGRIFQLTTKTGQAIGEWLKGAKAEDLTGAAVAAQGVPAEASKPKAPVAELSASSAPAAAPVSDRKAITPDQLAKLREYAATPFGKPLIDRAVDASGEVSIDTFTEEQAAKCIVWIQAKMNEAADSGYNPEAKQPAKLGAVNGWLAEWFAAHDAAVTAYLAKIKWIDTKQTWRDLPMDKVESVCAKTANFARAAGIPVPQKKEAA